MEAARSLISSPPPFPPRTLPRISASSVSPATAVTSMPTASLARNFPTSVLLQEQRDEYRPLLSIFKEDKTSQLTLDRRHMTTDTSDKEEAPGYSEQLVRDFQNQLLAWPGLYSLLSPSHRHENQSLSSTMQSATTDTKSIDVESSIAISLAKKALLASKQAVMLNEYSETFKDDLNGSLSQSVESTSLTNLPLDERITVRSTRLQERHSKKRRVPNLKGAVNERNMSRRVKAKRKTKKGLSRNDPFNSLFSSKKSKPLTAKEELEVIAQVQDLMKLEEVKSRLQSHFGREPTLVEWSEVVGISSRDLQSQLYSGNRSREKLICANLRLVVYVAKPYLKSGVSLQDLFQAGCMGLMTSVQRFKPQAGCRFSTYAYWWIRQTVRKASIQTSGFALPAHIHALLGKVQKARRLYGQEGNHNPTADEIAERVNITVHKLRKLLIRSREPISLQQTVWGDEGGVTYQEITEDTTIEGPEKELMIMDINNLLMKTLNPRERRIIRLRYGIEGDRPYTLSEIGVQFGISRERVRQLVDQSTLKLQKFSDTEGFKLEEYGEMLG
uniref:Sigma factor n=1 Tax=California macrophylla TaxID=337344 RepID=A0A0G2SUI9_9ROSI|nr:sigma factor [California macrophylla]